jgi:hypothetical protein
MKKILLLVLIAAVFSLGLTGCKDKHENPSGEHPSKEHPSKEAPSEEHPSSEHPK